MLNISNRLYTFVSLIVEIFVTLTESSHGPS